MNKKDYFFCYNKRVSDYLTSKGIQYITIANEMRSNRIFSLYEVNEQLQTALQEYKSIK